MKTRIEILEEAIRQYLGQPVLDRINSDPEHALDLFHQDLEASIMFMDVRSFTKMNVKFQPGELISELNKYHSMMSKIIATHNGYVDSIIGDAICAIFGLSNANHANDACRAAVACLKELSNFNSRQNA